MDENVQLAEQRIQEAAETRATSLSLSRIPLRTLPESVSQLTDLQILFAKDCGLEEVPPSIGRLKRLTALNLVNNRLFSLPAEVGQLSYLKEIYLTGNKLTLLPNSLRYLTRLREFYADQNQLIGLPVELSELATLEILWLGNNTLEEFPAELCSIRTLKLLGLSNNQIQQLPEELGYLERLEKLYVSGNRLRQLPSTLGNCQHITLVDARDNALETLPVSLTQRPDFREIYLHGNPALQLPELILGPLPEQVKTEGFPPTEAATLLQYYFTTDQELRGQLCLQTAAKAASVTRAKAEETALRHREQEARNAAAQAKPTVAKPTSLGNLSFEENPTFFAEKTETGPDAQAWAEAHARMQGTGSPANPTPRVELPAGATFTPSEAPASAPRSGGGFAMPKSVPQAPPAQPAAEPVPAPAAPLQPGAVTPLKLAPQAEPEPSPEPADRPGSGTGHSGHFLDKPATKPAAKSAETTEDNAEAAPRPQPTIQAPKRVELRSLAELEEEEGANKKGWGAKLFGGLLGKKNKGE